MIINSIINKNFGLIVGGAIAVAFFGAYATWKAGWTYPPGESVQYGFRGTAMEQVFNPRTREALLAKQVAPETPYQASNDGPRVRTIYPNLQVLGDLSEDQFNRLMLGFAEWVAPKDGDNAGCAYCHNPENMGDRSKYTHKVALKMIQMTRTINTDYKSHVANTGVTCYTCHRGQPVPNGIWFEDKGPMPLRKGETGWVGFRNGQNIASPATYSTSLPYDTLNMFLRHNKDPKGINVTPTTALPTGSNPKMIQDAEKTYGLMIYMSQALGVNCTFCHNSRGFNEWDQSPPQRVTAWHGVRMVRTLNETYLDPLQSTYPANRLGPQGDAPKAACSTCHQGVNKPLNGAQILKDYTAELGRK
jgi:photosynthetic reaction center cytochrome c subunit